MGEQAYWVEITKKDTGETPPRYRHDAYGPVLDEDGLFRSEFWWSEGNMACDCNRETEFLRAKGVAEEDIPETKCNLGESAYCVHITAEDGTVLYSERETEEGGT